VEQTFAYYVRKEHTTTLFVEDANSLVQSSRFGAGNRKRDTYTSAIQNQRGGLSPVGQQWLGSNRTGRLRRLSTCRRIQAPLPHIGVRSGQSHMYQEIKAGGARITAQMELCRLLTMVPRDADHSRLSFRSRSRERLGPFEAGTLG
jgi:hypothetical protein